MDQLPLPFSLPSAATASFGAVPILKWAGGKGALLAQYEPLLPPRVKTYFEPFVGSGAVFFFLRNRQFASKYCLSDINAELINLYIVLRDQLEALIAQLQIHEGSHTRDYYYEIRAMDRQSLNHYSPVQRAARMIYLNHTCYNGLWRVNSKGHFNVPMGRYKNPAILNQARLTKASAALAGVNISLDAFAESVRDASQGDFVYFDPPYVPLSPTSNFTSYAPSAFDEQAQGKLADLFNELHMHGCHVMLSNSDTDLVRNLYSHPDFRILPILAQRRINSNSSKRGHISEVVVLNYDPQSS